MLSHKICTVLPQLVYYKPQIKFINFTIGAFALTVERRRIFFWFIILTFTFILNIVININCPFYNYFLHLFNKKQDPKFLGLVLNLYSNTIISVLLFKTSLLLNICCVGFVYTFSNFPLLHLWNYHNQEKKSSFNTNIIQCNIFCHKF